MEEWGIWDGYKLNDGTTGGEWWADKTGLVFHTTVKELALAQLEAICRDWNVMSGIAHFSVKCFQTGEVLRIEHPGQAHYEALYGAMAAMHQERG